MKFRLISFAISLAFSFTAGAQAGYPRDYFRNPLDLPVLLAGNFGECRPNHFHTGLDFKTNEKENMKVYAAAEGYISRISISHSGYGNALYISHPNGYTTLYGHLNDFYPELQQYLVSQQYSRKSWAVDLKLSAGQFPVKKGQFIAFSGTTGGSTGPHLHFEIRDSKTEHVLNAALFGLPITDNLPPVPKSIAIYEEGSIYEQKPSLYPLKRGTDAYGPAKDIATATGKVRIAVLADDYMNGSPNTLGVYEMKLYLDGELQTSWALHDIDFDESRYVNAFADYRLKEEKGLWYQTLFRTAGNHISNYTFLNKENGTLDISDGQSHDVHIELSDAAGNVSHIRFPIAATAASAANTSGNCTEWKAGKSYELKTSLFSFKAEAGSLYDDICFRYTEQASPKNYSAVIQLHDTRIPLHTYSSLSIKLNKLLPFALTGKLVFVHHIKAAALPGNNPQDAAAAVFENGWARSSIRTFGNYYVAIDTVAPVIKPLQKAGNLGKARKISFRVTDNLTSVQQFTAELDGQWLRFVRSGNVYTYTFDERCTRGKHNLVISALDENSNTRNYTFTFTR
jgi:hypothetical protein